MRTAPAPLTSDPVARVAAVAAYRYAADQLDADADAIRSRYHRGYTQRAGEVAGLRVAAEQLRTMAGMLEGLGADVVGPVA